MSPRLRSNALAEARARKPGCATIIVESILVAADDFATVAGGELLIDSLDRAVIREQPVRGVERDAIRRRVAVGIGVTRDECPRADRILDEAHRAVGKPEIQPARDASSNPCRAHSSSSS